MITPLPTNEAALQALQTRTANVVGGTVWMWAREDFARSIDVLFIDEAAQMSLANALAASHAATRVVLLGDPQQRPPPSPSPKTAASSSPSPGGCRQASPPSPPTSSTKAS